MRDAVESSGEVKCDDVLGMFVVNTLSNFVLSAQQVCQSRATLREAMLGFNHRFTVIYYLFVDNTLQSFSYS